MPRRVKLIVGLGNPGNEYAANRHNAGFMCVNYFARSHGIRFDQKKAKSRVGSGVIDGEEVVLARPQTYMNRSGEAVKALLNKYRASLDDLIVVHDELDLPVGRIRIRRGGSSAGNHGIESIIAEIGTADFVRVRIGIGHPAEETGDRVEVIGHVLGDFTPDEQKLMDVVVPRVTEALDSLIKEGTEAAMNRFNRRPDSTGS